MKVKITTLVLCVMLSMFISAQQKHDSFFSQQQSDTRAIYDHGTMFSVDTPEGTEIQNFNTNAPLGNGVLILMAVSLVYVVLKRKEDFV